ncbi:hypothetical protein P167DRAFT_548521 [Morchella conica CCBAS932]|uniref:Uncharacterized protein n=1 Tax=Morchella conica CCBAS932 TaxID=1392247 RepID=A0A3N4KEM0_9PEZI|nr:hypothetical protein P167DRAFT_548521 [Morchella conica CCBAS932]
MPKLLDSERPQIDYNDPTLHPLLPSYTSAASTILTAPPTPAAPTSVAAASAAPTPVPQAAPEQPPRKPRPRKPSSRALICPQKPRSASSGSNVNNKAQRTLSSPAGS